MEQKIALQELLDLLAGMPGTRRFVMFSGLPGSGKSLLAKALGQRGLIRVSVDRIQKRNKMAAIQPFHLLRLYESELKSALLAGKAVVDDNLNLTAQSRKWALRLARAYRYDDVVVVRVDTPVEECLRRNAARKRVVPQDAILEMWHQMQDDGPINDVKTIITVSRLGPVSDLYEVRVQSVF